jgi:hypothetical protein
LSVRDEYDRKQRLIGAVLFGSSADSLFGISEADSRLAFALYEVKNPPGGRLQRAQKREGTPTDLNRQMDQGSMHS